MQMEQQPQPNAPAPPAPPIPVLYRHALESIFKFCALKDLHTILAVCRDWSSAVGSMQTTGFAAEAASVDRLSLIAHSRLARQVTRVSGGCASTLAGLRILADRMPWIEHFSFFLPQQGDLACAEEALALSRLSRMQWFFVSLSRGEMALTIESMDQHAVAANQLLSAAGYMRQLEDFHLYVMCHDERIGFTPLIALTRIRSFTFHAYTLRSPYPSAEQVAALRHLRSLENFEHNFSDRNGTLRLLLQSPTPPLRWTWAPVASGASDLVPQLRSIPYLSALSVDCVCGDVEYLLSLPRVLSLTLTQFCNRAVRPADLTRIVATLQRCPHLTSLTLRDLAFTSAQLVSLFPTLPRLSKLFLSGLSELTSLSFLATEALAASLKRLYIFTSPKVPSDEIVHLLGLRSLEQFDTMYLREPLSEAQKAQLRSALPRARLYMYM